MKLGLRSKILCIAALVIAFVSIALAVTGTLIYVGHHVESLQSRSQAVAQGITIQLERITSLGISIEDISGFNTQCEEAVREYAGVSYAMVVSPTGLILFSNKPAQVGSYVRSTQLLAALKTGLTRIEDLSDESYVVLKPVRNGTGSTAATVIVAFPGSEIHDKIRQMMLMGAGVGGVMAILGLLALYAMLQHFVARPVSSLIKAVQHIKAHPGDYSPRVPPQQDDEIGLLINGFNQLLENIEGREKELTEARDTSDKANRIKSDFLAAMSHDLRTPMHAILSMNELLRNTELNEKQLRYTLNIHKAGQWLLGIINDVLSFAKIEAGKLELVLRPFDLRQLADNAVTLQEDFARSKNLHLSYTISPELPRMMIGDEPRLMQMLTNLISNAIKYTDQGSIHLDVMPVHKHVSFSVTDTGIGIDPEKLDLLFEPFVQVATPTSHRRSGTGLGLSIVKQLAEAMGGEVGVDSALENGATFWFTAQLQAVSEQDENTQPPG